jgi:hypothetical protein
MRRSPVHGAAMPVCLIICVPLESQYLILSFLVGVQISLLARVDDLLIISMSVWGLRVKLTTLERWCARNFILINLIKTIILIMAVFSCRSHYSTLAQQLSQSR